jgi:thiosulfate dehydrogenase [quinone] large subunit
MNDAIPLWMLLPLRLYAGYSLGRAGLSKALGGWFHEPKLANTVSGWLSHGKPYEFYAPFLRSVVLPHDRVFTFLVVGGEVAVGLAMCLGLFSRAAAFGGLLLTSAFLLGQGDPIGANATAAFVAIFLTLLLTPPGRFLGIDAALRDRLPRFLG